MTALTAARNPWDHHLSRDPFTPASRPVIVAGGGEVKDAPEELGDKNSARVLSLAMGLASESELSASGWVTVFVEPGGNRGASFPLTISS